MDNLYLAGKPPLPEGWGGGEVVAQSFGSDCETDCESGGGDLSMPLNLGAVGHL